MRLELHTHVLVLRLARSATNACAFCQSQNACHVMTTLAMLSLKVLAAPTKSVHEAGVHGPHEMSSSGFALEAWQRLIYTPLSHMST